MGKRYQVFVSSTFSDLKDERQAALRAILELDHMPAGMELFPAVDDSAWQLIREVIDASDYYVLIVGGRYGSLDEEGLGYTEKEYDYAVSTKKPVIPLLHRDPDNLPRGKTETDQKSWKKLEAFREKVEDRHTCVYWASVDELKAELIIGLTATVKRHPAIGWVRADKVPSGAAISDLLLLKQRVEELESELETQRTSPPPGTEDLLQGDDVFELGVRFVARDPHDKFPFPEDRRYETKIAPTWNEVFSAVAPKMINETSDKDLRLTLRSFFTSVTVADLREDHSVKGWQLRDFGFSDQDLDTCIVQLRALGLITHSQRKRSLRDTATYWTLTPFGDRQMVILRALRRTPTPARKPGAKAERTQAGDDGEG